jgi:alginate O-acetyltransferase complex protein AlgI
MQFPTSQFFGFFVLVLGVYWSLPRHRWRMVWLLAASCVFYMSWNPWFITLILFSASVDYLTALQLEKISAPRWRRLLLVGSIATNLGLLGFFKYTNFFLDSTCSLAGGFGLVLPRRMLNIILPLGISFYTFETISYVVDVYRGRLRPVRNLLDYSLYIMFFPHLVAGPIVRPRDFLPQLRRPKRFDWARMQLGVGRFALGLFKKAVIADHLAAAVDPVFANPAAFGSGAAWLAVLGYAVQIYCDFSGYSDMAIGAAHMLGFKLPANFNMPYLAVNVSDFWKRWHISLSSWLRDYLYIPLGGSRHGELATCRNLLLTMLIGGLWHGASWTFVAWGLYHGVLLVAHRVIPRPRWWQGPLFRPVSVAITFLCVCVGWVFFRAQTFADATLVLERLAQPMAGASLSATLTGVGVSLLILVLACHLLSAVVSLPWLERRLPAPVIGMLLALLLVATLFLMPEDGRGFIYFQF